MKTFVTPPQPLITITYSKIIGSRERQEDAALIRNVRDENPIIASLADGLGGHQHGYVASSTAVVAVNDALFAGLKDEDVPFNQLFREAFIHAHHAVGRIPYDVPSNLRPATTLIAALVYRQGEVRIGSVGDSLIWLVRPDGRVAEVLQPQGSGNYVRYCVGFDIGSPPGAVVQTAAVLLKPGEFLVLATDGLLTLSKKDVAALLLGSPSDPALALTDCIEVWDDEMQDNCAVIVVAAGVRK